MTLKHAKGPVTEPLPGTHVADLVTAQLKTRGTEMAYYEHDGSGWVGTNWASYATQQRHAARAFMALGLKPGGVVAVLSENRPEWAIADVGAMMAGGMSAGIYQTCSPPEIAYILNHSEAPIIVVENEAFLARVAEALKAAKKVKTIVMMRGAKADHIKAITWEEFMTKAADTPDEDVTKRIEDLTPTTLGGLIYTSGTTGPPKAVGLSHGCIHGIATNVNAFLDIKQGERLLSYLPLSHIAEKALSIYGPMGGGQTVYFSRGMEHFMQDLTDVRPNILFGVPRVWEKLQAGLSLKFAEGDEKKQTSLSKAMAVGKEWFAKQRAGEKPGMGLKIKYAMYDKLAFKKIQAAIGLDEVRLCCSGAAAIAKETPVFFNGIGLQIGNVYGLSETGGGATSDLPNAPVRLGSVGKVVPNFEVKIADDDEIWIKGNSLFNEYVKDPEATAKVMKDGWFASGDLGYIDDDGYVFVTGRKKDLIITSGGKNITPSNLETAMMSIPYIEHAVAVGDGFHFISALVTLDLAACQRAFSSNEDYETLRKKASVRDAISEAIVTMNDDFTRAAQIREFRIMDKPLTIEDGLLTPTMKVKRAKVIDAYKDLVDDIYGQK